MLETIEQELKKAFPEIPLSLSVDARRIVTVTGVCGTWDQVVDIGHLIAKQEGVRNVVNELTVKGMEIPKKDYSAFRKQGEAIGVIDDVDVVIIGAGISGCGIARELSKYQLNILVTEMSDDVATGATKANNGNIHPGHAAKPGTLKARLNVKGNRMYTRWAEELGFELQRCGSMGVITEEALRSALKAAYDVAVLNGVDGVELVDGTRALEIEPKLADAGVTRPLEALWLPSMGLVEPYEVAVALAENAADNGVRFLFNCTVADILTENGQAKGVVSSKGIIRAKYVINCAGVYADELSAMAGDKSYTIHPRKGTIAILDKNKKPEFDVITEITTLERIQREKNAESKGGGMCRTPEWNILLGPSATETPDKEDNATTEADLRYAMGINQNEQTGYGDIIRIFAGTRPADYKEDFVIEMSDVTHGFINVGAIQSPGLASAPAIAELVEKILLEDMQACGRPARENQAYNPRHQKRRNFRHMSREEQDALIARDPRYGRIICRCESITEGEILDAIHSPVIPQSIDAIKRRTRAGMGRCQGGFCQPRVLEILARELGREWTDINLRDEGTNVLIETSRPAGQEEGER
ncbi:FAD-dependent oxidoreductase [Eubacterium sp. 1001713B170207_170306_E7]|uniref:FAD-dependent oxidoreductase n=1 Tax=Eubacterium sp. 1001713B170207_170306_E7 TaxID=2787097 RepID=UPI001899FCAC|nr:FAD-dependent oxidoreductase [Eubacterium sp. 1001713B170207_170306_E7]